VDERKPLATGQESVVSQANGAGRYREVRAYTRPLITSNLRHLGIGVD